MTSPITVPIIGDGVVIGTVTTGSPVIIRPINTAPSEPGIELPLPGTPEETGVRLRSLLAAYIDPDTGHLLFTYSDGATEDLGRVVGLSGSAAQTYRQRFVTPSTTWLVQHNLNTLSPLVELYDHNDEQYFGDVIVLGLDSLRVEFSLPSAGRVTVKE